MTNDIRHELEENRGLWAVLQQTGVREGQPLTVDTFLFAPDKSSSKAIAEALLGDGWIEAVVEAHSHKHGLFRRKTTTWAVHATRRLSAVSLVELDSMVEAVVRRATEHGAEFDGWGAEVPGTSS